MIWSSAGDPLMVWYSAEAMPSPMSTAMGMLKRRTRVRSMPRWRRTATALIAMRA